MVELVGTLSSSPQTSFVLGYRTTNKLARCVALTSLRIVYLRGTIWNDRVYIASSPPQFLDVCKRMFGRARSIVEYNLAWF